MERNYLSKRVQGARSRGLFIIIILTQKVAKRRIPPQRDSTHSLSRSLKVQSLFWCVGRGRRAAGCEMININLALHSRFPLHQAARANCFCKPDMDMRARQAPFAHAAIIHQPSTQMRNRSVSRWCWDWEGAHRANLSRSPPVDPICVHVDRKTHRGSLARSISQLNIHTRFYCAAVCKKVDTWIKNNSALL